MISFIARSSSSGLSYSSLEELVGFEVIRDQIMVIIPGQMLDFASSWSLSSSEQRTWSTLLFYSKAQ